jgi:hypothetical protein
MREERDILPKQLRMLRDMFSIDATEKTATASDI